MGPFFRNPDPNASYASIHPPQTSKWGVLVANKNGNAFPLTAPSTAVLMESRGVWEKQVEQSATGLYACL
jgi:hypothetical protein